MARAEPYKAMNVTRLRALLRKEFLQLLRDPVLMGLALFIFAESAVCAAALALEVQNIPLAVYDRDRSAESRDLVAQFAASPNFRFVQTVDSERGVIHVLDAGAARIVLAIPSDFSRTIAANRTPTVALTADGTDAYSTVLAEGYAENIVANYAQKRLAEQLGMTGSRSEIVPTIPVVTEVWYDPPLKYAHFNIVIMLALGVPIVGILLSAASLAREKDAGTLERMSVSPVRSWEFIAAKLAPTATLAILGLSLGMVLAIVVSGAPFRGNLAFLYVVTVLGFIPSAGIGVLVATATRNTQQAILLAFFVLFPLLFLSGTVTPLDNMPTLLQNLMLASPLRYYGAILINIFFKGGGLSELWPQVLGLAALSVALFGLAFWRLRRGLQT
jgi:ABC-2 type transport system permease protein